MDKIQFDIKYRPEIESGEYKVITAKEQPVRIICWDRSTTYWKIIALVLAPDGKTENPFTYDVNGKESDGCLHNHELDLFLVTPEPELSEFEKEYIRLYKEGYADGQAASKPISDDDLKEYAAELLSLARKELQPEIDAEVEKAYKNADRMQYEKGKEDAMKDLPRWKKADRDLDAGTIDFAVFHNNDGGDHADWLSVEATNRLYKGEYYIELSALKKLPKEE